MISTFANGLLEGILISLLLFGPAFFKLVNVSMQEGVFKGWWLATGVLLSDLLVVLMLVYGLSGLFENIYFKQYYSLIGGLAMIGIGLKAVLNRYKAFLKSYRERSKGGSSLLSGLLLNLMNPFTFILWFNVLSAISLKFDVGEDHSTSLFINLLGILVSIYLMDMLKVFFADLLGKKISHKMFYVVNKYFGGVFIIIGLIFIVTFVRLLFQ